jgi:competence protein ComEC
VIASLLLAPVVFIALIGGFLKIILTALLPPLAGAWATMAAWPISWMRIAVDWLSLLPGSEVPLPGRAISFIIVYYALLLLPLLPTVRPKLRLTFRLAPVCAVLLFAMIPLGGAGALPGRGALRVTVLAIGAGQCCVIETPQGKTIVLDAGSSTLADPFRKCIAPFLRNRGISAVDELWISHTDYDHLNAAAELISAYGVKRVRISAQYERIAADTAPAERLLQVIGRWGVELDRLERDETTAAGGVRLDVLWPPGEAAFGSNDSGLVLKLAFARRTILFPADIEGPAQAELLRTPGALACDVLIAPHHGSFEDTTTDFVRAADPLYIISSNDRTLSQKQRSFERTIPQRTLLRTNRSGAVTIVIEPDGGLTVTPFVRGGGESFASAHDSPHPPGDSAR